MRRKILSLVTIVGLLGAASVAMAQAPITRAEQVAVKKLVVQNAKAFLKTEPGKLARPSYRITSIERTASGALKVEAGIFQKGGGWMPFMNGRIETYGGAFKATKAGGDKAFTLKQTQPWMMRYYMEMAPK